MASVFIYGMHVSYVSVWCLYGVCMVFTYYVYTFYMSIRYVITRRHTNAEGRSIPGWGARQRRPPTDTRPEINNNNNNNNMQTKIKCSLPIPPQSTQLPPNKHTSNEYIDSYNVHPPTDGITPLTNVTLPVNKPTLPKRIILPSPIHTALKQLYTQH